MYQLCLEICIVYICKLTGILLLALGEYCRNASIALVEGIAGSG